MLRNIRLLSISRLAEIQISKLNYYEKVFTTLEDNVLIDVSDLPNGWYQILLLKNGEVIDSGNVMISN